MSMTGHCLCGAITYTIEGDPVVVALCHCDHCQRTSGAAFSTNVIVERGGLSIAGEPRVYTTANGENGAERERLFCGACGSTLMTLMADRPDLAVVKAGTLDDRSGFTPALELWCDSKQGWVTPDAGRTTFPKGLPAS